LAGVKMTGVRLIPILRGSISERPLLRHFLSWRRLRVNATQKTRFATPTWLGQCKNGAPAANFRITGINIGALFRSTFRIEVACA